VFQWVVLRWVHYARDYARREVLASPEPRRCPPETRLHKGLTEERILECIVSLPRYIQNLSEFGFQMKIV